ncbi:MAG: aspartyl protease family protein, partial [Rhodanobacteraceae bacterium]
MRRMLLLAILAVPALALAATAPTTATQILAQAKAASGGAAWNRIHSMRFKVTIKAGGLTGTLVRLEDLSTGRSVAHFKLGPIAGAQGFDGNKGWTKSPGGEIASDDSPAAMKSDVNAAYQTARAWWFPKRWPGKIESLGTRNDGGKAFRVLRITPRGGHPFELWTNAKTHLVVRSVDRSGVQPQTTYFSDFRTVHGIKVPFHERSSNGKKKYDRIFQINKVVVNVPLSDTDFAMPKQAFHDTSIIGGGNKATIPFKLVNNHIYIPVTVNGHSLRFIVDTGAQNILTREAARRADIKSEGALQGGGGGKKSVSAGLAKIEKLVLGDKILLKDQPFGVLPMPGFSNIEGTQFDGLVGYELFKRFVVRIDYADQKLTFIRPADFDRTDAGTAVPFTLAGGGIPFVKGSIDGISGEFEIDLGERAAL